MIVGGAAAPGSSGVQPFAPAKLLVPARALVVGRNGKQLRELSGALSTRGVSPYTVDPDTENPFSLIEKDPRISVVLVRVNELSKVMQDRFLRLVFDQPGLTTVAFGSSGRLDGELRKRGVITVPATIGVESVAETVFQRLSEHSFDPRVLESLEGSIPAALADCQLDTKILTPVIRVGADALADFSAIVAFAADDLAGRVVVAGSSAFFERLSREWIGKIPVSKSWLWDASGELCNRVTGQIRGHYHSRGFATIQSNPTIIEGEKVAIRCAPTRPGLVVPFEIDRIAEPVYVELVLINKAADHPESVSPDSPLVTGELTFL